MKNKMKKIISITLVACLVAGVMSGCGGKKDDIPEGKTKISVWGWPDENAEPKKYASSQKDAADFMEQNPDIIVEGDQYKFEVDSFSVKAEGGALPTLYNTHFTECENIAKLGYAKPITELLKSNGYYDKFNDYIIDLVSYDGDVYYFPKSVYTLGIIANLEIFEKAGLINEDGTPVVPQNWDELAEMAKTIKEKTGIPGFVMPTTTNVGGWLFTPVAWSYGVKFMEENNGKWTASFDTKECVDSFELLKKMKWEYDAMPAETLIDAEGAVKLIGTGQAAMTIGHPDMAKGLPNYGFDINSIGMFKMPAGPVKRVTLLGGTIEAIASNATDAQAEAVLKWLEFKGYTPNLNDERKSRIEENYKLDVADGKLIGIIDSSIWNDKTDRDQYVFEMIEKYRNVDIKNLASYNDKSGIEYQTEEPKCTQELYSILDSCIQEVLTNKDADIEKLLEKAASDFQNNSLDYAE